MVGLKNCLTCLAITMIIFKDLYGTIGGSLNVSLSNNPVFLGRHFTRVEPLEVIALYDFRCNPRVIMVIYRV